MKESRACPIKPFLFNVHLHVGRAILSYPSILSIFSFPVGGFSAVWTSFLIMLKINFMLTETLCQITHYVKSADTMDFLELLH